MSCPAWRGIVPTATAESGATLPVQLGAHRLNEADVITRVKNAELADAVTPLEAWPPRAAVALGDAVMAWMSSCPHHNGGGSH
jgi:hypothetical protein